MTFQHFVKHFAPILQVYGKEQFPQMQLERMHHRVKDLTDSQMKELVGLLLDNCKFAPKGPDVIEWANAIRAKGRQWTPPPSSEQDLRGDPTRVAEVRKLIEVAFGKPREGK